MYVSDWIPPKTPENDEIHIHGADGESEAFRPLMVLVVVVLVAVTMMFACDYRSSRPACTVHVTAQQC